MDNLNFHLHGTIEISSYISSQWIHTCLLSNSTQFEIIEIRYSSNSCALRSTSNRLHLSLSAWACRFNFSVYITLNSIRSTGWVPLTKSPFIPVPGPTAPWTRFRHGQRRVGGRGSYFPRVDYPFEVAACLGRDRSISASISLPIPHPY